MFRGAVMYHILIIEDDVEINRLLTEFLEENGYYVVSQYNGLHILDILQENKIDLVLLDIMLPYKSGDSVLADIRKQSTVPVIIISAKGTTQNKVDLLRLGADDYITKPFDMEEALARIESNLRRIQFQMKPQRQLQYKNETAIRQSDNAAGFVLAYAISIILGVFAILNQINLTVTNLLNRRHEIGILKSVGMTNEQLIKSFFIEGMMISGMAILLTILLGIPGGYCIGGFLKNAGMATGFQFPKVAFSTFIVLIILVESAMTLLSINSLKKQSVIEAIST